MCSCGGEKCSGALLLIEKSTAMVLWTSSIGIYENGEWVPTFPMQADKDGKQVWPKTNKVEKQDEPHPTQNIHKFVSRPEIIECGLCGRGREEAIHF
jgi:hypothetical protein